MSVDVLCVPCTLAVAAGVEDNDIDQSDRVNLFPSSDCIGFYGCPEEENRPPSLHLSFTRIPVRSREK